MLGRDEEYAHGHLFRGEPALADFSLPQPLGLPLRLLEAGLPAALGRRAGG